MNNNLNLTLPKKNFSSNNLGNNFKNNKGLLGNIQLNFNNLSNSVQNTVKTYRSYSPFQQFLIVLFIIILLVIIAYLIYRRVWIGPSEAFFPEPRTDAKKPRQIRHQDALERISDQYTYSFWVFINGVPNDSQYWGNYRTNDWKHILNRGHRLIDNQASLQSPGFWLSPNNNKLYAALSTNKEVEFIALGDIDMDQWVNVTFVRRGQVIEAYKNGKLEKTLSLYHNPVPSSRSDILITQNGGFAGNISYIQYFNRSLGPQEIRNLFQGNKRIFNKDLNSRVESGWAGFEIPRPIEPSPEPEPEPDSQLPEEEGVCS